jgi:hypothetical protein
MRSAAVRPLSREELEAEFQRLDRFAEQQHRAWRTADIVRDLEGNQVALRRSAECLEIVTPPDGARLGAVTLRSLARILLDAAQALEQDAT